MTFELRKEVPKLCGGRAAIIAKARELLSTTHTPLPGEEDMAGHVTDVLLHVIRENIRTGLEPLLWKYVNEVVEGYQLVAGDPEPGADISAWDDGLDDALEAALAGDIEDVLGAGTITELTVGAEAFDEENRAAFVKKLTNYLADAKPHDVKNVLAVAGIKPADVNGLCAELDTPAPRAAAPAPAPVVSAGGNELAGFLHVAIAQGMPETDLRDHVEMLADEEDVLAESAAHHLGARPEAIKGLVAAARAEAAQGGAWLASLIERARNPAPAPEAAPAPVSEASKPKRTRKAKGEVTITGQSGVEAVESSLIPDTTVTQPAVDGSAAKQALAALCDHANVSEREIAEALGVSRATMNNYRNGKTPFNPTQAQVDTLAGMLRASADALQNALFILEN